MQEQPDTIFERARLPDGTTGAIAVSGGRIVSIGAGATRPGTAREHVDLAGALVVPGFVEGHIHLDKSWIGDRWKPHVPNTGGFDVRERIAFEKALLEDAAPMDERASALIELAVSHGTTHMRSHVDVDATVGLRHLETVLAMRETYRDAVAIELVAFPQSGILTCPGTAELLDEAIAGGTDRIGGIDPAGIDGDVERHLDVVFGIAERRGVGVDIHLHDPDMLGVFQIERIADRTRALGLQGNVAVSHAYCLGDVPIETAKRTAEILARSGVAIMTNAPGAASFPPIRELRKAGVVVFSGSDNVRDSWWPYGNADMLERAMIIGYRSGFYTDAELELAFDLVTAGGARALGIADYGLSPGAMADFVVLDAQHVPEAVVARPRRRAVYKSGKRVSSDGRFCGLPARAA